MTRIILLTIALAGCAAVAPFTVTPRPDWTRAVCGSGFASVPVRTSRDADLERAWQRVYAVAGPEADRGLERMQQSVVRGPTTAARRIELVVIRGSGPLTRACGSGVVAITADALERMGLDVEATSARWLAHELAHLARGHPLAALRGMSEDDSEREADALGVYYAHRAGYDCGAWVQAAELGRFENLGVIREACALARRGARHPLIR